MTIIVAIAAAGWNLIVTSAPCCSRMTGTAPHCVCPTGFPTRRSQRSCRCICANCLTQSRHAGRVSFTDRRPTQHPCFRRCRWSNSSLISSSVRRSRMRAFTILPGVDRTSYSQRASETCVRHGMNRMCWARAASSIASALFLPVWMRKEPLPHCRSQSYGDQRRVDWDETYFIVCTVIPKAVHGKAVSKAACVF